jgi:hypothetical protein
MKRARDGWILFLYLLAGGLIGSVLGEVLSGLMPILQRGISLGLTPPAVLNLWFIKVTLGFQMQLNLAGALGMVLAFIAFRR